MFAVMDGTICGDGAGPRAMIPVVKDYMLASDDMVAIDAVSAWLMGFDPMADVDCIRIAHERGLGVGDVREIEVVGEDVSEVNFHFQVRYHFASRVGRLLWFTPLARIQSLFFKTPLVHAFIWGSSALPRPVLVAGLRQAADGRRSRRRRGDGSSRRTSDPGRRGGDDRAAGGGARRPAGWSSRAARRARSTVTVAIDRRAWCRVETGVDGVVIESQDTLRKVSGRDVAEVLGRAPRPVARVLRAMGVETGVRVVTQSRVPEGSGLGESAALAVAVAGAVARALGRDLDREEVARIAREPRPRARGWSVLREGHTAVRGGVLAFHPEAEGVRVETPRRGPGPDRGVAAPRRRGAIRQRGVRRRGRDPGAASGVVRALREGRFEDVIGLWAEEWDARWGAEGRLRRASASPTSCGGGRRGQGPGSGRGRAPGRLGAAGSARARAARGRGGGGEAAGLRLFPARVDLRGLEVE